MTENEPTDEHPRPGDGADEAPTEAGRPRPADLPAYPRPQPVPDPPAAQPQFAPPVAPQPYQSPPQPPQPPQPTYPPAPQQPYGGYHYPAPVAPPPPQQTVQGGGGTLWLRPDSGVHQLPGPAPPAEYLGAPVASPYPAGYPMAPVQTEPSNSKAVAAMVLGIVGLVMLVSGFGIAFIINLPCSILAWIFGVQGSRMVDSGQTTRGDGMAKAGIWTGAIGTVIGGLAAIFWIIVIVVAIAES